MPDPAAPPFDSMSLDKVMAKVRERLQRGSDPSPAFATIFGAGFSYPLIPLASAMVRDVPWWLHCVQTAEPGAAFTERPLRGDGLQDLEKFEKDFWAEIVASTDRPAALTLDPQTGRPDVASHEAMFAAYQSLMDPRLPGTLGDPSLRRGYMRAAIGRVENNVNRAHAFLASILSAQRTPEWEENAKWSGKTRLRRPFCRTVFTTNFDPLMQRSLQLAQTLYFMTDRPETLEPPNDDDHHAIHLLYTHGSAHRYTLLNTQKEIEEAEKRNAPALAEYLKHKGVFVIGYSGWRDTLMSALRLCKSFDGNLYWFDVHTPQHAAGRLSADVVKFLKDCSNAFYVQATADEAMAALHAELGLGDAPRFVLDPLGPMRSALDDVVLPEPETASAIVVSSEVRKAPQILANMQAQLERTRERLKLAHEVFLDPSIAEAGKSSQEVRRAVMAAEMQKADAAYARGLKAEGKDATAQFEEAIALWLGVAHTPARLDPDLVAQAWQNAGVTQLNLGRREDARKSYDAGLAVPGISASARFLLHTARGYLLDRGEQWAAAEQDYRATLAIARAERNVEWESEALNDVAGVLMELNRFDEAANLFESVLALPGATIFQRLRGTNNLGVIAYRRGDLATMRRYMEQARALDPDSPYPPMNLALIRLLEGDGAGGLEDYRAALAGMTDADFLRRAVVDLREAQTKFRLDPSAVTRAVNLIEARALELGG